MAIATWVLLSGCTQSDNQVITADNPVITGSTMGTYFRVETTCANAVDAVAIEAELERLTLIFSTYRDDSEISRINASTSGIWLEVDNDFVAVAQQALRVFRASEGAFDPTIGPWVELWGFGAMAVDRAPTKAELDHVRSYVGYNLIAVRENPPAIRKNHAKVRLDFSGNAKGFAIDQLAESIEAIGCVDYLVDIGGDVRVAGLNAKGLPWRIGIEDPLRAGEVLGYVETSSGAIATSGTYLNKRMFDGSTVSHLIDPRTGMPVTHDLLAVAVMAADASIADAWATALGVAGVKRGMALVKRLGISALLIERDVEGELVLHAYGNFKTLFRAL